MTAFTPTRAAGLERLQAFLPRVARYAEERGHDWAGRPTTSRLSPWLQRRLLTEEEVVAAVAAAQPWPCVEKYVEEVCWRTYWKGWLEHRPALWTRYREACARLRAAPPAGYEAAIAGRTGIDAFDHWARELIATGWLHNHARMWFASIWTFTLRLPWELGADFFLRHLLDGDAAVNTLSWRWVAGLHTPGKAYLARAANIEEHTGGRFRPEGLAAVAVIPHEPPLPSPVTPWVEPPRGPVAGPHGLWLHPEDLAVEIAGIGEPVPGAVLAAWPMALAAEQGWSETVTAFGQAALADGAARAAEAFGAPLEAARVDDVPAALVAWAQAHGLRSVIAMRPAVGPWRDAGLAAEAALAAADVSLVWRQRRWDARLHRHAGRGFAPFWHAASRHLRLGE